MNRLIQKIKRSFHYFVNKAAGGLSQKMTSAEGGPCCFPEISEAIRTAAAESIVLLKNDGVLPLDRDRKIAVFGRCQNDWFYVGYGSGGDVHAPYRISLMDALRSRGAALDRETAERYLAWSEDPRNRPDSGIWGHWPAGFPEMPLEESFVQAAASGNDAALVVIGRAAGEDRDLRLRKGEYYLTDDERAMLRSVTAHFKKTVLLMNTGNVIDMGFTEEFGDRLSAILMLWLGGMEAGNAAADVLYGDVSPSGRLPDSIARNYRDYPGSAEFGGKHQSEYSEGIFIGYRYFDLHKDQLLYPFGYGLSYTDFRISGPVLRRTGKSPDSVSGLSENASFSLSFRVQNTGKCPGKDAVLLFVHLPEGNLEKPRRVLAGFSKTHCLAPGEETELRIVFDKKSFSSYDEAAHAFVLEPGSYKLELNGRTVGSIEIQEEEIIEQCHALLPSGEALRERILSRLPAEIPKKTGKPVTFSDLQSGRASIDDFIAQLSDHELEALSRGHGMMGSRLGIPGNAGVFGGITPSLREKGLRPLSCCDGPAGIRFSGFSPLLPCGTALAAGFNTELVESLHVLLGKEMTRCGADVLLSPGMNLHRNPLCGRNFEYFSEDPLLSGKIAGAAVRGIQRANHAACPKHFACNHQERRRNRHDARVSERTLRELYLRNFEIVVREAEPLTIMTSYNKVNGVWSHYHYELVTTVLREEWGFRGLVLTDWWMKRAVSPEFPRLRDNAYRVRAQVDVLMPGDRRRLIKKYRSDGTLLKSLGKQWGITRGELQRTAKNVLRLMLKLEKTEKDEKGGRPKK